MGKAMLDGIAAKCLTINPCARGQEDDHFFQIDQSLVRTSEGNIAAPMLFYDASHLISLFTVDAAKLAEAIDGVAVTPALDRNGKGIVGLAFYEYRHASIAAYNEVGLPLPGMDLLFYTEVSGHPMEIPVDTNYIGYCSRGTGMSLKIGESDHAMAQTLRMLDLDSTSPFVTQRTDRFRSRLHAPRAFS